MNKFAFKPVERNTFPCPVPYIYTEDYLPKGQKILVFLPHSDDGRYIGASLYLLNKQNDVRIVIVSPGDFGVDDEDLSKSQKREKRWGEALCWAEMLGFHNKQIVNFRADQTYYTQKMQLADREKMTWFLFCERPTTIFVPSLSDTAQSINYFTRLMAIEALCDYVSNNNIDPVLLFEYPTNHVPFLPPSDKNFTIVFSDNNLASIKHEANKAHESQSKSKYDLTEKMTEAISAVTEADYVRQLSKRRKVMRVAMGADIDPMKSRGEHFGVTKVYVADDLVIEERLEFPLGKKDLRLWNRDV